MQMKTKSQARVNGSSSRRSKQPQSPPASSATSRSKAPGKSGNTGEEEFAEPNWEHPTCLCIYDRASQVPVKRIPLTDDEIYDAMEFCIREEYSGGADFDRFVAEAIREKLAMERPHGRAGLLDDLERMDRARINLCRFFDELRVPGREAHQFAALKNNWDAFSVLLTGFFARQLEAVESRAEHANLQSQAA